MSDEEKLNQIDSLPDNTKQTHVSTHEATPTVGRTEGTRSIDDAIHRNNLAATDTTSASQASKKRNRPLLIFLLIVLIAAVGAVAGVAVYKAYFEKPATPAATQSTPTATTTPTSKLTAKQVVALVTPKLSGAPFQNGSTGTPLLKVTGYNFYTGLITTNPAIARYASTIEQAKAAPAIEAVNALLVSKDFTQKKVASYAESVENYYYLNSDVACLLYDAAGNSAAAAHMISIDCADMSAYEALAKSQKPYADIYLAANRASTMSDESALLLLGAPTVKDSKTAGYRTAQLSIGGYTDGQATVGGFVGLFYQTPDKIWHYFKGVQGIAPCTDYATPDLKKAYLGETCHDTATNNINTTVKE